MASASDTEPALTPAPKPPERTFGIASRDALPVMAVLTGLASSLSGQQPTGNSAADFVWPFVFGAAIVWLSQHASRRAMAISAVLALFFSGLQFPAVLMGIAAVVALLVVVEWQPFDADSRVIGCALSAAFVSQASLNLPNIWFAGSASLLAAIATAPILLSGHRNLARPTRRRVNRALLAGLVVVALSSVMAVIAALGVRDQVEVGITQAEDGISALESGDQPQAVALLDASQENFQIASDRLGGPLTWPARWVPVVAQHSRALETASDQGVALAETAARTVNQADVEKIRGQDGIIDLEVVDAVNAELNLANSTLQSARQSLLDVDTPWLLPVLSSRLDSVQDELIEAGEDIDLANHATSVLPGILGADAPRRYLVLFVQPAESRDFGGFVGAYGILEVDQGRFELTESGGIDVDLGDGAPESSFTNPDDFPVRYVRIAPNLNPQNLTATADLSTIAAAARDLTPQWRQDPNFTIDGVISLDPYAMAGLLQLTGPLKIEGRDAPVDSSNVVDFLLRDQYLEFEEAGRDARQDVLRVLAAEAFGQLLTGDIPGPEELGSIFGPIARANRLSFVTFDDQENAFLDRIYLSADLPEVGSAVDMVGVFGQTVTASKLDGYASRSTTYDVAVDPATGAVEGTLTIVERNDAPADANDFVLGKPNDIENPQGGPLGLGSNFVALSLYLRGEVGAITADTSFDAKPHTPALSYVLQPVFVEVPLGGSSTTSLTKTLQVPPGRYDIYVPAQATANVGEFTLTVRVPPGWRIVEESVSAQGSTDSNGVWSQTFVLDEARGMTFSFERTS